MFIQRILRNAVLAELLLFLMVANCAPSRPREDAGRVPGNPAASYLPSVVSSSSGSSSLKSGHRRKAGPISSAKGNATASERTDPAAFIVKDHPPNEIAGLQRVYRWSTACSSLRSGGDLLRLLPNGTVDARGGPTDPDTDIELSSVGPDGKVYIRSKTRNLYLCFTKKGKLVTREKPGEDKTLCQFYDMLWQGNRRFVSVYRRNQQQKKARKISHHQVPWSVPLPGSQDRSWKDGNAALPPANGQGVGLPDGQLHTDDWQVGFGRSGESLKGSAWRNSKHRNCFDLVEHVDHVRSSDTEQVSPVGSNQMSLIFQRENSVPERSATAVGVDKPKKISISSPARKSKASHQEKSPAKDRDAGSSASVSGVSKNSLGRTAVNHKNVGASSNSWKSGLKEGGTGRRNKIHHHSSGRGGSPIKGAAAVSEEHGRAPRPRVDKTNAKEVSAKTQVGGKSHPAETELFAPVEFWKNKLVLDDAPAAMTNVDFDSYLAETERLLAHPEEVIGDGEDVAATAASVVGYSAAPPSTSSPVQRTAFIQRDSGGWEEVIINQSDASLPAASASNLQQHDDMVVIDDRADVWQTQMKWNNDEKQQ
ncbi:uncharacterized protein LOC130685408 isoform X2 [Daphnia carinata]|uniref:uncharacterized protein LOC130685408 isoform X2 n=1 Tax=Daphnia carinata TaxID=120202 RepID=UPI00257FDF40|nr:uncharacterized protein LOC130685408 isoform X2 [Daphnia carinata]